MSLDERRETVRPENLRRLPGLPSLQARLGEAAPAASRRGFDRYHELRTRMHSAIVEELGPQLTEAPEDVLEQVVVQEIERRLGQEPGLGRDERQFLAGEIKNEILGYGPLEHLLADDAISEIMVNGPYDIWVECDGRLEETPLRFTDENHLRRTISRMLTLTGRRVDESSPMVDARLPDGSRLNAVIPPLAVDCTLLTIRKFAKEKFSLEDLARLGTLSDETAAFLELCIQARLNVLVSGGTGAGKTTLLNALSGAIPDNERIVTIEDAAELQLKQRHVLRLEARQKNIEGEGEITIRELVRNSLRMRPDRIVVGEVRGAEALDMLQAMNTGHDGSLSTIHANSARDALARVETMVLMAGFELPVRAIRSQISSAMDLIIHLERMVDGARRVTSITEVQRMEGDVVTLQDVFHFELSGDQEPLVEQSVPAVQVRGRLQATGLRPIFLDKFAKRGLSLPASLFTPPAKETK